jgi:hypothetical protein
MIASHSSPSLMLSPRSAAGVEGIEAANPNVYQWGGAEGWNNNCISLFIEGGLSHFEPARNGSVIEDPTWKDLASFLWCGRFME